MSIFNDFMNDIFSNEDFLEECIIEDKIYKCIASALTGGIAFTEAGLESDVNFTLDICLPVKNMPVKNQKVIFRNKKYKISYIDTDSANASIKLYLISLSKGIG
jgi:hypothetical protein